MGRWSHLLGLLGFAAITGCAAPSLNHSSLSTPSMGDRVIPEITTQPIVNSTVKAQDADLPPEKSAKLCLATAEELEKNGHLDQAIAQYELALKHQPGLPGTGKKLAACYARQGQFDKAIEQYQKGLAGSPKDADLLNDIGYTYYEKEDFVTAEKYLRQAITSKPSHQRAHGNLGLALGRQCKWKESLEEFKKAGSPATAQANLAAMYLAAGKAEEARRSCNIALGLEPNHKTARELLAKLDELPKEEGKTVKQAEAKLLKQPETTKESASAQVTSDATTQEQLKSVQLQKPVRVNRQTEQPEFRPVKQ